jgi:predicted adenine nucleotide alpha hydrolase (AANH) superfamily ATPase
VKSLQGQGLEVTAFWYNPNVHPFREHQQRLQAMETFAQATGLTLIVEPGYDMARYFQAVVGHEADRCPSCYRMRLARTADTAQGIGFDAFTTTLLISPYQDHELIRRMGGELAEERGLAFHYEDFRPGFREGHRMSRELGLYHQGYCGCLYSEWERYGKR